MTSAMLNAERVLAAADRTLQNYRNHCTREGISDDHFYDSMHPMYRVESLGALAEAAIASGQCCVSVSIKDYRLIHVGFATVTGPVPSNIRAVTPWR